MARWLVALLILSTPMTLSLPALATTWLVDPQGGGDFETIQAAINAAANGDTILLTPVVYTGDGNKNLDLLGKILLIRPEEIRAEAVIDCEGDGRGFDFSGGEPPETIIEDVAIINGHVYPERGGAIRCSMFSSPTLLRCRMEDNFGNSGGAVACTQASPSFVDCQFLNNTTAEYGGGGGISLHNESDAYLRGCWIEGNVADYTGGLEIYNSDPVLEYCTIVNNTANRSMGGGIGCQFGSPVIDHCTIVGNVSPDSAGGIFLYQCMPEIGCTVIAYNGVGAGIWCFGDCSDPTIASTDIYGNAGGDWVGCIEGMDLTNLNLHVDPAFCDWQNGDYTLEECSPLAQSQICGYIGAWDVGCSCSETGVLDRATMESESWSSLKKMYR